jgi:tyrosine aminotransferase
MMLANEGDNFVFPSPSFPLSCVISAAVGIEVRFYHLDPHKDWKADLK